MAKKGLGLGVSSKTLEEEYQKIKQMNINHSAKGIWQPKIKP
jgi:hypothetical protein